jgi:hypothetical protein
VDRGAGSVVAGTMDHVVHLVVGGLFLFGSLFLKIGFAANPVGALEATSAFLEADFVCCRAMFRFVMLLAARSSPTPSHAALLK